MTHSRSAFEAGRGFLLDDFQRRALDSVDAGRSVLVAAPTGSGKTLVAEYAIASALAAGRKAFYTTPIKALSNQKYGDLAGEHGAGAVGLLTGDNSINGDAPVVVMTTEVLRNMIYAASPALSGLLYVVLDEVHYLQNPYRGSVWEEVIIHLPPEVRLVCLSATVSNAEELADWIGGVRGETDAIIEEARPVELTHLYAVGDRNAERIHLLPTFVDDGEHRPNPEAARLDSSGGATHPGGHARRRGRLFTPMRSDLVELLSEESMLPAIFFIFSRAACDDAVRHCLRAGVRLTSAGERRDLIGIAEAHTASLSDDDLDALGYGEWLAGLEAGVAAHHAGLVPPMKEAVEEAFAAGLAKVVFATETLALGINMPARSVVIEKLSKFTGERHEFLTPGEYTQLAGRAGRRGIDTLGYSVVCWSPFVGFEQVASLASRRTYALTSSFRPTYNMAVNLVRRYPPDRARHLLNLSFAQYHADRGVVSLEHHLERDRTTLERLRSAVTLPAADLASYRRLLGEIEAARRSERTADAGRIGALRPGDVLRTPKRGGRVVVLRQDRGRGGGRVLALTADRELVRLGLRDLGPSPRRAGRLDLPHPFRPNSPTFRRSAADALRRMDLPDADADPATDPAEGVAATSLAELEAELAAHPLAGAEGMEDALRAMGAIERIEREMARRERRAAGRSDSLARQLDRVLGLLEGWGYVQGWELTPGGELLARIYSEADLLVTESLREGLFDGLGRADLAAVVSCFTYERRGPEADGPQPPRRWPSGAVRARARSIDKIWHDLNLAERDARLHETRPPDPGFAAALHGWVSGEELADVIEEEETTGGDFVRNTKQCIDLLRQVGEIAPDPATAATARSAADAAFRGVIAASSVVGAGSLR